MTYRDSLSPWCIIQHLPNMQRAIIARFRKRQDTEEHLRLLQRLNSTVAYELIFDLPPDRMNPAVLHTLPRRRPLLRSKPDLGEQSATEKLRQPLRLIAIPGGHETE
jgi:hypothetical protein